MAKQGFSASAAGTWLMIAAALVGLAVSAYNYFDPQSGIEGEPGTILVIVASAILAISAWLLTGHKLRSRFARGFFTTGLLIGIAGTAFAGYMLHSQVLVIAMIVALVGWLVYLFAPRPAFA
jgi:hypothetical protein